MDSSAVFYQCYFPKNGLSSISGSLLPGLGIQNRTRALLTQEENRKKQENGDSPALRIQH